LQLQVSVSETFSEFVESNEAGIRHALIGQLGTEVGRDAAAQALLYGLENWGRVSSMENPAGYLFRVGQRWGRHHRRLRVEFEVLEPAREPWFEPGLGPALRSLPAKQRVAVILRHGTDMSYSDIALLTNSVEATVRKNVERGLASLREILEVDDE
jgi:DNA-directed RNA polymerase specialized sigma24 family protein